MGLGWQGSYTFSARSRTALALRGPRILIGKASHFSHPTGIASSNRTLVALPSGNACFMFDFLILRYHRHRWCTLRRITRCLHCCCECDVKSRVWVSNTEKDAAMICTPCPSKLQYLAGAQSLRIKNHYLRPSIETLPFININNFSGFLSR